MKHSPENNAQILSLNAPSMRLTGTRRQRAEQLLSMFDEAEERIKRENQQRGNRETVYSTS
ncbi:hypothetical protein [Mangrovibacter phragmitis]|uniref:hypothetical protein n=1 Tax=Mangrovibacter phragmitis TaxID=1691903 RepID=UPI0012E88F41|nr:hypothetical protein [Mangrovibacter phragmitis]